MWNGTRPCIHFRSCYSGFNSAGNGCNKYGFFRSDLRFPLFKGIGLSSLFIRAWLWLLIPGLPLSPAWAGETAGHFEAQAESARAASTHSESTLAESEINLDPGLACLRSDEDVSTDRQTLILTELCQYASRSERTDPAWSDHGSRLLSEERSAAAESRPPLDSRLKTLSSRITPWDRASRMAPITRLRGEAIYGLEAINTNQRVDGEKEERDQFFIGYRLRLNIDTTFNGHDRLRIRLQSRTIPELQDVTGTPLVNLSFDGDDGTRVEIGDLWYRFAVGKQTDMTLTAVGASLRDTVPAVNPLFNGSGRGSLSVFGSEDPILRGVSGVGIALSHDFNRSLNLTAAGISRTASDSQKGILGDRLASILQLTFSPDPSLTIALAWNTSRNEGFLRSQFEESDRVSGNAWSAEIYYRPAKLFSLGLRAGLIRAVAEDLDGSPRRDFMSYAALIGFPDLGGKDNLLGFVIGRPPYIYATSSGSISGRSPFHFEVFYRYMLSDFLSLTPGVLYVDAPNDQGGLQGYWIGAMRLTFRF